VRIPVRSFGAALVALALVQAPVMGAPAGSATSPLGVVLQANHAAIGAGTASNGATVFDGDTLVTNDGGALRVGFGTSQAYLLPSSSAIVKRSALGFGATLTSGTVILSSAEGGSFRVIADGATIRPNTPAATAGQITRVGPSELLLTARKGSLEVSMDDETKTVPEGTSVRMLIEPADAAAPAAAPGKPPSVFSAGRNRFIFIVLTLVVVGVTVGIIEATLSPHKP
jgi:hypothetical protein